MISCRDCGLERTSDDFYLVRSRLSQPCKACISARNKTRRPRGAPTPGGHPCAHCGRPVPQKKIAGKPRKYCGNDCIRAGNAEERKARHRRYQLARYGLHEDQYEQLGREQQGRCAVCRRKPESGSYLHVDHDHMTGHVRGLLCGSCNRGIGLLADEPKRLRAAAEYVARHRQLRLFIT